MKKHIFILLPIIILIIIGCDMLNDDIVYKNPGIQNFFNKYSDSTAIATAQNLAPIMNLYSDDYSNNLQTKEEMHNFYNSLFGAPQDSISLQTHIIDYTADFGLFWNIYVDSSNTIIDTISMQDELVKIDDEFIFYGNHIDPPPADTTKPIVFVEFATSVMCGSCPPASNKLRDMWQQYGDQFVYIEYCFGEPMDLYAEMANYYTVVSQPTSIFQGSYKIEGPQLDMYDSRYEQIVTEEPMAFLNVISVDHDSLSASGSIEYEVEGSVSTADLFLRVALIDKEPELYYHSTGDRLHNVIFALAEYEVVSAEGELDFEIEHEDILPEQTEVVFWLQTRTEEYDPDVCKVYTVTKEKLY